MNSQMAKRVALPLACASAIFVWCSFAYYTSGTSPSQASSLRFARGDFQKHHVDYNLALTLADPTDYAGKNSASSIQAHVSAEMSSRVVEVSNDSAWIGIQLSEVDCSSEISQNPECTDVYETPFLVEVNTIGHIKGYSFPNSLSADEETKLRALIDPLNITPDLATKQAADAQDSDSVGTALVRYSRTQDRVEKRKLDYLSLKDDTGYLDGATIHNSHLTITTGEGMSWFDSLRGGERLSLTQQGKNQIEFSVALNYEAIPATDPPAWTHKTLSDIRQSFSEGQKRPLSRKDQFAQAGRISEEKSKKIDFTLVAMKLTADMNPGERIRTLSEMADHIRTLPERTKEIGDLILNSETSDSARSDLFYVLQSAETEESQSVLAGLARDEQLEGEDKKRAVAALGFMPLEPHAVETLWELTAQTHSTADRELAQVALFSLGTASDSMAEKYPEASANILKRIQEQLAATAAIHDDEKTGNLLLALGNARDDASAGIIAEYLASPSDKIRTAAAEALDLSGKDEYMARLSDQLLIEESPDASEAIINGLLKLEVTEESFISVMQRFVEEDSTHLRLKLARYFITASQKYPDSRKAIKNLMRTETDTQVFELLARASVGSR